MVSSSTLFVGREAELADIARLLSDPACRLLTLVGPGGIGKTRLALEAARPFPSVHFVPLQPLTSPDFIVSAIADAVGFQFYSGADPRQQLLDYLREKSWLLVLDNFEHLLDGATLLSEIVASAPGVRLLVTSRERLNLVEEWTLDVGGLAYPSNENDSELERYSAVELFMQHARRVKAGFTLTEAQRPAVSRICRLVGGMPLALELAASWVRALSCETIADEIEHSLDILETPARNVEPRHRTMRAAFEPTWERLTEHERDVFMRLSVFRGGFTREAAKEVAGAGLAMLASLADKSLLRVDAVGRYDLHELLRQYAVEKLTEAGEVDAAAQCHLDYFLRFAEQVDTHNFGREQIEWYDRAEIEFDNLRAALARSVETETGLRIAAALGWFFSERAKPTEGTVWLERTLATTPDAPSFLRAKALQTAARLVNDLPRARAFYEQALVLTRTSNDRWNKAWVLSHVGMREINEDIEKAKAKLDESLRLFRELEDSMGLSHTLVRRSWIAMRRQDYPAARGLLEEAWILAHEAEDIIMMGWIRFGQGQISEIYDHDLKQTKTYYDTGLALFREARFSIGVALVVTRLAQVELILGDDARAQTLFKESVALWGNLWPEMTPAQIVAYALEDSGAVIDMTPAELAKAKNTVSETLNSRELEILRLIADGLTNGEIAEQLVLAKSTIKWYVRQIFSKLDATSRTQAVARARSSGLLS